MAGKRVFGLCVVALVALFIIGSGTGLAQEGSSGGARNVIIFVGDGMGTSHRDLIRYATVGEGQLGLAALYWRHRKAG